MDLFDVPISVLRDAVGHSAAESPCERAQRRVREVIQAGHPICVAFSAGKDSSALANIVLCTAAELRAAGDAIPPIIVVNSDTGVDQPEVVTLAVSEVAKMQRFAQAHDLPVRTMRGQPALADSFAVRVIGGRALPSFPDTHADCTNNWKIKVNERLLKQAMKDCGQGEWKAPVVMTGVRQDESQARNQRIAARGEVADALWSNEAGHLRSSPILDWSTDDVWEYVGEAAAGARPSYSDFQETMRIYRDGGGSSCVVVADMRGESNRAPCGVRTGCWACTRVRNDRSMENMLESDPQRYGYLRPLAKLRNFISNTQYDWSRRQFVGRSIDEHGNIAIGADSYNPDMLQSLLRYSLSAQVASGVEFVSLQALIAIDARWSMYGLFPPFTALKIAREIEQGRLEFAPEVAATPKSPTPKLGHIHVGTDWYDATGLHSTVGLRDPMLELFHESCGVNLRSLRNGALVADYEFDRQVTVDAEGAGLFLDFEADRHIDRYCREDCEDWTLGYKTYLRYGTIQLAKGNTASSDAILRRTQWRQAHRLHGQRSAQELEARPDLVRSGQGGILLD